MTINNKINKTYIYSAEELPQKCNILIYGAGGRGRLLLETAKTYKSIKITGFIDSFKSGELFGLPVFPLNSLKKLLDTKEMTNTLIVIASTFHRKMTKSLENMGIAQCMIFLEPDEGPQLVDLPIGDISSILGKHKHPLVFTRRTDTDWKLAKGEYLRCNQLQNSNIYLRPSGISICCWMPDLTEIPQDNKNEPEQFKSALMRMNAARKHLCTTLDKGQNPFCQACPSLFKTSQKDLVPNIGGLSLDISIRCNLNCSYCIVKNIWQCVEYDFKGLCDYIINNNLIKIPFQFDWGGAGEPTINPSFESLTKKLLDLGGRGLVYTNALQFSQIIADNINNRLRIVCSIDAGTSETYKKIRGVDAFERVWQNIKKYIDADGSKNISLKYIVTTHNASTNEIKSFIERCKKEGIQTVILSRDFYNDTVTSSEKKALALLIEKCKKSGISYNLLQTAISENLRNETIHNN
ncbi:MAG: radical SAM protein [Desulfamplus sp.]|nr:radical SAM protein [Desulfamplus sp.]